MTNSENGNEGPRRRRRRRKSTGALALREARQIGRIAEKVMDVQKAKAIELRLRGQTYREIGDALGVDTKTAARMVNGVLRQSVEIDADKLEEQRQLEVDRLERMWATWFPRATRDGTDEEGRELQPNMAAATLCLKIAKRRAELIGLDREQRVNLNVGVNVTNDQLQQLVAASQNPEAARALEMTAALFAHGETALDGEFEEIENDPSPNDPDSPAFPTETKD